MTDNKKVIVLDSAGPWRLFDYVSPLPAQRNAIEEWYRKTLSRQAQANFDTLLRRLVKVDAAEKWLGWRGYLHGAQSGLWELGFKADNRAYRIVGMMGPKRKWAILLIGCYHKGNRYMPESALGTATERRKKLLSREASSNERTV